MRGAAREQRGRTECADQPRNLAEARIAAEQLVSADTRERHLETGLMRRLADEERVEAVGRRLIHGIERHVHVAAELVGRYPAHVMLEPEIARRHRGERNLILCRSLELAKSQGDRDKGVRRFGARDGGKYARVYSRREKDPDRRV